MNKSISTKQICLSVTVPVWVEFFVATVTLQLPMASSITSTPLSAVQVGALLKRCRRLEQT